MKKKTSLGAVTACVSGVAHTYMAAEALEQLARRKNYHIQVETQGALGIENLITSKHIKEMDCIVIAADIVVEKEERFSQKRCIYIDVKSVLLNISLLETMIERILLAANGTIMDLR